MTHMNFQDLQIFLHLADTQNFAKTATQNHMSPSTLSRQIQRMEEELEQSLFIRDNRQVRLTEQGEKFLQFAKTEWQNWQQMPFILPLDGMARQRIEQWLRSKHIKHPKIYATVAGHEGIVPMVLGFGLAMLPDVVIDNNPMSKDVSRLNLDNPVEAFDLGVCVQKRNLANPLIRAFWEMLD